VLCIQLSLVPKNWASNLLDEYDDKDSASRERNDRGPELSGMPALLYCLYYIHQVTMYIMRAGGSSIVGPKMSNVPRPTGLPL